MTVEVSIWAFPTRFRPGGTTLSRCPRRVSRKDFGSRRTPQTVRSWGFGTRYSPVLGVQFHPESILTPQGDRLLQNFLEMDAAEVRRVKDTLEAS